MQTGLYQSTNDVYQRTSAGPSAPGAMISSPNMQVTGHGNPTMQRIVSIEMSNPLMNRVPTEIAKPRGQSPLRVTPQFGEPSQASQLRRPASQVPLNNRSLQFGNMNEGGSVSNFDKRSQGPLMVGPRPFGYQRLDKDALRDQISVRNKNVKELTNNKRFFTDAFGKKTTEFKEKIRVELKTKIFDKVLKSNLHYIYKHYENFRAGMPPAEAQRILTANMTKQNSEIAETRRQVTETEKKNRGLEQRLLEAANQIGLIKEAPELVENITRADVETKIRELNHENSEIERALLNLKKWKDSQLYTLKMKHEMKGRRLMEEKAIRLALQYVDPQDSEQLVLKQQIENLLREIELKHQAKKGHPINSLLAKRDKLKKQLELLKFSQV